MVATLRVRGWGVVPTRPVPTRQLATRQLAARQFNFFRELAWGQTLSERSASR